MKGVAGLTAEQFYDHRDQRTALVVPSTRYRNACVQITLASDATSFADQIAFLTAVNLTARWCRSIALSAPAVALDARLAAAFDFPGMTVVEAAAALAHAADPFGHFSVDGVAESQSGFSRGASQVTAPATGPYGAPALARLPGLSIGAGLRRSSRKIS